MNLRISENELRFRITREEAEQLMGGDRMHLGIDMGMVRPEYAIVVNENAAPLSLQIKDTLWELAIDKTTLSAFVASLPSREGIEHGVKIGTSHITLVLEVDVRRKPAA